MHSVTVVIPVFNERQNILKLYNDLVSVLNDDDYELIFVDDGSTDNSYEILSKLKTKNNRVHLIKFQRNFGKSAALNAAFKASTKDVTITIDGDLQDDPKEIPRFLKKIDEGYGMISGWKFKRRDPLSKVIPSKIFNSLARWLLRVKLHDFNCGFKAYKTSIIKNLSLYGELHRYLPALVAMKGYRITEIKVVHHARRYGKSKYGFSRIFKGVFDLITVTFFMRYSKSPLYLFGTLGFVSFAFGTIGGLYLVVLKLLGENIGSRPIIILIALLIILGVQFVSLGLLAELIIQDRQDQYVIEREE